MSNACSKSNEQMEPTDNKLLGPNSEGHVGSSIQHAVSPEQGTRQDGSNPHEASLSSPTVSLISSDSFGSSGGDYSVDCNRIDGHNLEEGRSDGFQDAPYKQQSASSRFANWLEQAGDQKEKHREEKTGFVVGNREKCSSPDANDDNSKSKDDCADEESEPSPTFDVEDQFWDPPEPENDEDDQESVRPIVSMDDSDAEGDNHENNMAVANLDSDKDECANGDNHENSMPVANFDDKRDWCANGDNHENGMAVANFDDKKDGCANGDGIELGKPTSLSSSELGGSRNHCFEEERQKAMVEVMNGKFKALVSQLLKKVGVDSCDNNNESWVDIVTQLAWEAALFIKPDPTKGNAMDAAGYVKVKCVASGSRSESQFIKGLVFKKHAALKSMTKRHEKPRLLLIQGMLQSSASSGFASLQTIISPEEVGIRSTTKEEPSIEDLELVKNLQACHPDVIMVEKSASRALLEKIADLKITVVLDMKLHRLERVACCTGSPILSTDTIFNQRLKCCESVHFEKFVEEHASVAEGEKKPCKTLMFLEGCPTCQGCTILLKGSHGEELKKIKSVVQFAVVMAYHFILETSFLVHQKAMFATIAFGGAVDIPLTDEQSRSVVSETSSTAHHGQPNVSSASTNGIHGSITNGNIEGSSEVQESNSETTLSHLPEMPISSAFHEERYSDIKETSGKTAEIDTQNTELMDSPPTVCYDSHTTIHDVIEKFSIIAPDTFQQVSTFIELNGGEPGANTVPSVPVSPPKEAANRDVIEMNLNSEEGKPLDDHSYPMSTSSTADGDAIKFNDDGEDYIQPKDEISSILDSESILVLMSSRNALRGTICEQSHLSHIKFYRNFDVPLGTFLRDNLFNQSVHCKACGELPEAHFYYYAHHNKQLTIRVKRLLDKRLPGEYEGKLWMWSRCGKCEPDEGKATKRVLISTAASGLSFGKFLELSFSSQSSFNRLSSCGHSLQKDFLHFFGLGSMAALFRYSRVAIYTVSVPAQKLEFNSSVNADWLQHEIESVLTRGLELFREIGNCLKKIESRFSGSNLVLNGSSKAFDDIIVMLNSERSEFEEKIKSTGFENDNSQNSVHILLRLNQLRWEILLEACVWEQRLQLLLSSTSNLPHGTAGNGVVQRQVDSKEDIGKEGEAKERLQTAREKGLQEQVVLEVHRSGGEVEETEMAADEAVQGKTDMEKTHCEGTMAAVDNIVQGQTSLKDRIAQEIKGMPVVADSGRQNAVIEGNEFSEKCSHEEVQVETVTGPDKLYVKEPLCEGMLQGGEKQDFMSLPLTELIDMCSTSPDSVPSVSLSQESEGVNLPSCLHPKTDKSWLPEYESEDEKNAMKKIHRKGDSHEADKNPPARLIPVVSSYLENSRGWVWNSFGKIREGCMKDLQKGFMPKSEHLRKFELLLESPDSSTTISQVITEEGSRLHIPFTFSDDHYIVSDYYGEISSSVACALASWNDLNPIPDESASLQRACSEPNWSSKQSYDPDMFNTAPSMSFTESWVSHGSLHPEVILGAENYPPKGKYSVVILYAEKFRALRNSCGASELDYVASLSRCKIWDAKGGKSKSVFAKTLDDRLIIKEIKKTEYDSFMKFANDYFKYMEQSFNSGNQTCLAKILGIYQVTIRHPKSSKETKHDLMVQENLSFGRNITRQYDLKGALHARFTTTADGTGDVLLDQNFVNDMNSSPLYVGQKAKRLLQRAVWNDTTFLTSINVMDYSLLVGVDRQRKELVCGIIDYLRQYTWDKQLETWVKISLVTPKNMLPTIISPKEYKKRFRKFMDTHFLTVPDNWCLQRSSNPCKLCGIRSGDSSPVKSEKQPEQLNGFHAED